MQYLIDNGILAVTVDSFGAEVVSIKHNGVEKQWQNQTGDWAGHAPVLFPFCGNCQVWVQGKHYEMNRHGFARVSQFELVKKTSDSIAFKLSANEQTKTPFPYCFDFVVKYSLSDSSIFVTYDVLNPTDTPIYVAMGGHESFWLDKPYSNYKLIFEQDEIFDTLCHRDDGRLTGATVRLGQGKELPMPCQQLANKHTVIFGELNSRKVTLSSLDGAPVCEICFEGFANLLLWSPDGNRAICIEPWHNLPDTITNWECEFATKKGVVEVAPNSTCSFTRVIKYFE